MIDDKNDDPTPEDLTPEDLSAQDPAPGDPTSEDADAHDPGPEEFSAAAETPGADEAESNGGEGAEASADDANESVDAAAPGDNGEGADGEGADGGADPEIESDTGEPPVYDFLAGAESFESGDSNAEPDMNEFTLGDALGAAANVDLNKSMLDQDEIDRLMNDQEMQAASAANVMELIANSTIVNYERLPMLDVVFDRFVRLLADNLRHFMTASVEVNIDYVESVRFGDFWVNIPVPSVITVMEVAEWQGNCLSVVDQKLIYTIIENLLGGRDTPPEDMMEVRPLTSIERKITHRVMGLFTRHLTEAFEPLCKATFEIDRLETNPQLAQIARDTNAAVHARFSLEIEGRLGSIDFVLPYSTLEPVRQLLLQMFMGENFGKDTSWEQHFSDKLQGTDVVLQAVLHETEASLSDTLDWKVGTFLPLTATADDPVRMLCSNLELLRGSLGQRQGNIAIRIDDTVFDRQEEDHGYPTPA